MKRREEKSKGGKERYKHLNAEFQRIARRDKKAFLSDQCKDIEENNSMGNTTDLLKKIRDTRGTFYAKMGSIKDRNDIDLTETEDIKKMLTSRTSRLTTNAQYWESQMGLDTLSLIVQSHLYEYIFVFFTLYYNHLFMHNQKP